MLSRFILILIVSVLIAPSYAHAQVPDMNDRVGILTVHSNIKGQSSSALFSNIRGHSWLSWLSFQSFDGKKFWTVGTWNEGIKVNDRTSQRGINFNLELKRHPSAYRRLFITKSQYKLLIEAIDQNNVWSKIKNCSFFASTVWNEVTGEQLNNWSEVQDQELRELFWRNDFGIARTIPFPCPLGLFDWIYITNGNNFNNDANQFRTAYEKANPLLEKDAR